MIAPNVNAEDLQGLALALDGERLSRIDRAHGDRAA